MILNASNRNERGTNMNYQRSELIAEHRKAWKHSDSKRLCGGCLKVMENDENPFSCYCEKCENEIYQ